MQQKKNQQYQSEEVQIAGTTITIRKSFVILAVVLSVIAAYSQLFADPNPEEIIFAKIENNICRNERDQVRDHIFDLIGSEINKQSSSDNFNSEMSSLLELYTVKKHESFAAHKHLLITRQRYMFNGFPHLNSFLAGIGIPLSFFLLTLILFILGYFLKRENYKNVSKSIFLIAQVSIIVSVTYIIWALYPSSDLPRYVYVFFLLLASFCSLRLISWFMNSYFENEKILIAQQKLKNVISRLFDYVIIEISDQFIAENQKKAYIESYDNEIKRISKIVK